jgi:hypothetical protein
VDVADQQREDVPADVPAPSNAPDDRSIDDLLDAFDRAVQREAQPAADTTDALVPGADATAPPQDGVDAFLASLDTSSADRQRIDALTGEIDGLRAAELDRQSRSDFEGFSKKLQAELGPNVDEHFARTNLLALAVERPELEAAWRYRNLTNEQRRAADLEFKQIEALYAQAQRAPDDPRKAEALAQMERRGQELGLMMNARTMLNNAWRDVVKRAEKVKPMLDEDATQTHLDVAAAVRGASTSKMPAEPPPNLGTMSDQELRRYTREHFGFE